MKNKVMYLASSSLSIYLAQLHHEQYHPSFFGVLLIDKMSVSQFNHQKMMDFVDQGGWDRLIDFSKIISDTKPSKLKKFTRWIKVKPFIRKIYSYCLQVYLSRFNSNLMILFHEKGLPKDVDFLYTLYDRDVNSSLLEYLDCNNISYYEHGIGDYSKWLADKGVSKFYCLLHNELRNISPLEKKNFIHEIRLDSFPKIDLEIDDLPKESVTLWILQPLELYNVNNDFWIKYTRKIIGLMRENKSQFLFIKKHPKQSKNSLKVIYRTLKEEGIITVFEKNNDLQFSPVEIVLSSMKSEVSHVVGLFSSALFYLSNLQVFDEILFYYSFEFFEPFARKGPAQFQDHFKSMRLNFENNFTNNLIDFHQDSSMLHKF